MDENFILYISIFSIVMIILIVLFIYTTDDK